MAARRPAKAKRAARRQDLAPPPVSADHRARQRLPLDFYHRLLTMPWWMLFLLLAASYVTFNLVFAALFMLQDGSIADARPHSFADAFFFSVQTMATIGYGEMRPSTFYANFLVTFEVLLGMTGLAIASGLVFARFSRPTARVHVQQVAVIVAHDGVPSLMFRAANQRRNQILEAQVTVMLLRDEISGEGVEMRRFHDMAVSRPHTPMFALTWTVIHPIDEFEPALRREPRKPAARACANRHQHRRDRRDLLANHPRAPRLRCRRDLLEPALCRYPRAHRRRPAQHRLSPLPRHGRGRGNAARAKNPPQGESMIARSLSLLLAAFVFSSPARQTRKRKRSSTSTIGRTTSPTTRFRTSKRKPASRSITTSTTATRRSRRSSSPGIRATISWCPRPRPISRARRRRASIARSTRRRSRITAISIRRSSPRRPMPIPAINTACRTCGARPASATTARW